MKTIEKPSILIIDDIIDNLMTLGGVLEDEYDVQFASSGREGLELVRQQAPDLILLDVMMPGMDGYEVFAELSADPKTMGIPVIFVTAFNDTKNETRALVAGAVDFIHKPINSPVVLSRVKTHLMLRQRELELQRMNEVLENRVRQRTAELEERTLQVEALNIALEERAQQAETANLAKRQFLGKINHELRTPLNGIIGYTELLQRKVTDPAHLQKLEGIGKSANNLASVINEILNFTDIDSGKLNLVTVDFDLNDVIQQVSDMIAPRAIAQKLAFTVEVDSAIPTVLSGDPGKLGQVLINLVGNAVKFTPQGSVNLRASLTGADEDGNVKIRFDVRDTGIGIEPSKLNTLFEPFEQSDNTLTRPFGGIGLGLSINRKLVEMMGGETGVESELGKGSTFWATFKLKRGKLQQPAKPTELPALEAIRKHYASARLLLVEDDSIIQEIHNELLIEAGLNVDMANDGKEAVAMAALQPYDLILMGVQMPFMNGLDATQAIRKIPGRESTPIIAVSGNDYDEDKQRCLDAGMNAFLAKPVQPEILYGALLNWLGKAKRERQSLL
jgi:signal transduction histidine kinase/BarA-like signal transduction histidine kinase